MEYEVRWTREQWFKVEIQADSPEEAQEKFWSGDYENEQEYGAEIQEDIDIFEITELR